MPATITKIYLAWFEHATELCLLMAGYNRRVFIASVPSNVKYNISNWYLVTAIGMGFQCGGTSITSRYDRATLRHLREGSRGAV